MTIKSKAFDSVLAMQAVLTAVSHTRTTRSIATPTTASTSCRASCAASSRG
jgi:hypothetical protein